MAKQYSVKADGSKKLTANFTVREFACRDGSDTVLIDGALVALLQRIRDHFGASVTVNSGYRTKSYNAKVGGVSRSQHMLGTAADIVVKGVSPLEVARYAEYLSPKSGGIGVYKTFTHVDVRAGRARWDNRSGKEVAVSGWPGYVPPDWYAEAQAWVKKAGISDGERPDDPCTRAEVWAMLERMKNA